MSNASRTTYRGLVIPDERATLWEAECSNLTLTAGQVVGTPEEASSQASDMALRTLRRARTGSHSTLRVTTQTGGMPSLTGNGVGQAASFVWSPDAGTTTYGWDAPNVPTGWRSLKVGDNLGTDLFARVPHACVAANGDALIAYEVEEASSRRIDIARLSQGGTDWITTTGIVTGLDDGVTSRPCLLTLPSGRIILFHYVVSTGTVLPYTYGPVSLVYIQAHYSDDNGTTWALLAESVIGAGLPIATMNPTYSAQQIRCAASPSGQVVMFVSLVDTNAFNVKSVVKQYASSDGGISFTQVDMSPDEVDSGAALADVIHDGEVFVVAWLTDADEYAHVARLGSAFQSWRTAEQIVTNDLTPSWWDRSSVGSTKQVSDTCLALTRDASGVLYLFGVYQQQAGALSAIGILFGSYDRGRSWVNLQPLYAEYEAWWLSPGNDSRPDTMCAISHEGRVLLPHQRQAQAATGIALVKSVAVLYLGGYSTVTSPHVGLRGWAGFQAAYTQTYLPFDLPDDVGWSKSGTNTAIGLATGSLHHSQSTLPGTCTYSVALDADADHASGFGEASAVTNGVTTSANVIGGNPVEFYITHSDGSAHTYGIRIAIDATHLRVHKRTGTTSMSVVSTTTIAFGSNAAGDLIPVAVRWVITDAGECRVWYRMANDSALHSWTQVASTTLTNIWASISTSAVSMRISLVPGDDAWIYGFAYSNLSEGRAAKLFAQDATTINGMPYSVTGTYITDSASVTALGGPTHYLERWDIGASYDFDASRLLLPNPRTGWRSINTSADIKLAFLLAPDGNETQPTDVLAIGLFRTNIGRIKYELYDASTLTWSSPVAVDLTIGDLRWARTNASVRPNTGSYSGKPTPLFREGEFNGAQLVMGSGKTRVIRRGTGGKWTSATTKKPVLYFNGEDGTEGSTGSVGRIIARDAVVLISTRSALYSAIRITIPTPDSNQYSPAEGVWRAGSLLIGNATIFSDEMAWGRELGTISRREIIGYDDGTQVGRIMGPPARRVAVGWSDGIDTRLASEDSDDPDYHLLDTSGVPLALSGATPWDVEGIYTRLSILANDQIVYLPKVDAFDSTPTPIVINRRHNLVLGRIENDSLNLDTVQGDESVDEVIRIGTVTIGELT